MDYESRKGAPVERSDLGYFNTDPVHQDRSGEWFFWDETWCDRIGPYDSREAATSALARYCKEYLNGDKNLSSQSKINGLRIGACCNHSYECISCCKDNPKAAMETSKHQAFLLAGMLILMLGCTFVFGFGLFSIFKNFLGN